MQRLSATLAALVLGFCIHASFGLVLEAQQACPDSGVISFAAGSGSGCGDSEPAPSRSRMIPGIMDRGSDVALDLRYLVGGDGTVVASAVLPEQAGAMMSYLDHERGIYRTFDLGALDTLSTTQGNIARIHRWMQIEFSDAETPVEAVTAYLNEVDAIKLTTRAELLRGTSLPRSNLTAEVVVEEDTPYDPGGATTQQQRDCEQWAVMTLETSDIVWIPMVRTKNDTRVRFINGRRLMDMRILCWGVNPSRIGTTWHTAACRWDTLFWRTRAESRLYHAAYNDDFNLGASPRHWVRHWIDAQFDHVRNRQTTLWNYSYSGPSGPTFNTSVIGRHSQSTC